MTLDEFDVVFPSLLSGVDAETMSRLAATTIEVPEARRLRGLDPFSARYKDAVLDLYSLIRGKGSQYDPERDENSKLTHAGNVWLDYTPWSYHSPTLAAEFLFSWGNILRHLQLDQDSGADVIEYGAGAGQLILTLARMGVNSYAVDIDPLYLDVISQQASVMGVNLHVEKAEFGWGFGEQKFDRIIFFEAFHHCLDFVPLLQRLRARLKEGGKLILAGEPILATEQAILPYPWGPRLDALSVFCIKNQGWMELGFTEELLQAAMTSAGLSVTKSDVQGYPRATTYVAELGGVGKQKMDGSDALGIGRPEPSLMSLAELKALRAENLALRTSTSWRLTAPLRKIVSSVRRHKHLSS